MAGTAVAAAAMCSPISVAVAAPASAIAGTWKGPYLSTVFTFEFTQTADGWTGRYQSEKYPRWVNLQNVRVADGIVRFDFPSTPRAPFTLKIDAAGKSLSGSGKFGPDMERPVTLARAS